MKEFYNLTHSFPMRPFSTTLKTSENFTVSDVFRGYRKGALKTNGFNGLKRQLKSLNNEPTCFKDPEKPTCIDLILTNRPTYFQLSTVLDIGLSDFHLLNNSTFRSEIQSLCSSEVDLGFFKDSIFHIFIKHAPIKKTYLRANEAPFIT